MELNNLKYYDSLIRILRLHRIFPSESEQSNIKREFYRNTFLFYFCISLPELGFFCHFYVFKSNSTVVIEDMMFLVIYLSIVAIFSFYCYNLQEIIYSLNRMHKLYRSKQNMARISRILNLGIKFIYVGIGFGIISHGIFKILDEERCQGRNLKNKFQETCFFLVPVWFPLSFDKGIIKYIILCCQAIFIYLYVCTLVVLALLLVISAIHIINGIKEFKRKIRAVKLKGYKKKVERDLRKIVEFHYIVNRAIDECNSQTQHINLVCFICTGFILALLTVHVLLTHSFESLLVLFFWVLFYSTLVMISQGIIDEWLKVTEEIYNKNWYEMDVHLRYYILMILQRTQKIAYLKAGPIASLSRPLLLSVYKTAYSYIAMLLNVKYKR